MYIVSVALNMLLIPQHVKQGHLTLKGHSRSKVKVENETLMQCKMIFCYYVVRIEPFPEVISKRNPRDLEFDLSRSSKVKGHVIKRKLIYDFLSVGNTNRDRISNIYRDI